MKAYRYVTLERYTNPHGYKQWMTEVVRAPYIESAFAHANLGTVLKKYIRNWVWVIKRNIKQDY